MSTLDSILERKGITKAELSRRMGTEPANMRRLFTSMDPNPTLQTLVSIATALGYELTLVPRRPEHERGVPPYSGKSTKQSR